MYGVVDVNYTTMAPTESYQYIPSTLPRADNSDYLMTSGTVRFVTDQEESEFNLQILDDLEPEENEAVYVRLTGVTLIEMAQIRPGKVPPN